jgi:hypothetical protein
MRSNCLADFTQFAPSRGKRRFLLVIQPHRAEYVLIQGQTCQPEGVTLLARLESLNVLLIGQNVVELLDTRVLQRSQLGDLFLGPLDPLGSGHLHWDPVGHGIRRVCINARCWSVVNHRASPESLRITVHRGFYRQTHKYHLAGSLSVPGTITSRVSSGL